MSQAILESVPTTARGRDAPDAASIAERYAAVRAFTESLCDGMAVEDYVVQSMTDVSPTKWHLAHTTWFFETFVLRPHMPGYEPHDEAYAFLFNSYYVQAGERHCRAQRGYLSRPTVAEVYAYRRHVDEWMATMLGGADDALAATLRPLLEIGLNHEQQHQELLLTDLKHVYSVNPLRPVYRERPEARASAAPALRWIGHPGEGFAFDNEGPRHREFVAGFELASRLTTNREYLAFMEDGGYTRPELWLSMGWAAVQESEWSEPFYWERRDGRWWSFTLGGMREIVPDEPVVHLSYFEADAFARWAGARLPTEFEWEIAAATVPVEGNFSEEGRHHPSLAPPGEGLQQMFGDAWEWTRSAYAPYPGYEAAEGALGEYNGKWMCNQFVLRGGSCATPRSHIRATYRNFFHPDATWQFSGVRLARDA